MQSIYRFVYITELDMYVSRYRNRNGLYHPYCRYTILVISCVVPLAVAFVGARFYFCSYTMTSVGHGLSSFLEAGSWSPGRLLGSPGFQLGIRSYPLKVASVAGYGDLGPKNITERTVCTMMILTAGLCWAYVLGYWTRWGLGIGWGVSVSQCASQKGVTGLSDTT